MSLTQLVFNSFPRSANVYLGHAAPRVIDTMCSTVHMPEIFIVKSLPMVTVFRKPEDAIASLINKQLERSGENFEVSVSSVSEAARKEVTLYREYLKSATDNHNHLYIAKFDDITSNTLSHLLKIAQVFSLPIIENNKESFEAMVLQGDIWSNRYDGHLPREKGQTRMHIEEIVYTLSFVKELSSEYYDFIEDYAS